MNHKRSLLITGALALVSAGILLLLDVPISPLRIAAAGLLVLFLPGYAITLCLFPKRLPSWLMMLNYAVGISIVVAVVGGLVTDVLTGTINAQTWLIWLAGVTSVFTAIGLASVNIAPAAGTPAALRIRLSRTHLASSLMVALGVAVLAFAFHTSSEGAAALYNQNHFTQLWAVPSESDPQGDVQLGIRSQEAVTTRYTLVIEANGTPVRQWTAIRLQPGETWLENLPVSELPAGRAEIMLYLADNPNAVYRRVEYVKEGS